MTLADLINAMGNAGTQDLRGVEVLPYALEVIGTPARPALANAVSRAAGLGRDRRAPDQPRAPGRLRQYDQSAAVRIMDAWWPLLVKAEFQPVLGSTLLDQVESEFAINDEPGHGTTGAHLGSAFDVGFYGIVQKDLRSVLREHVRRPAEPDLLRRRLAARLPRRARELAAAGRRRDARIRSIRPTACARPATRCARTRSSSARSARSRQPLIEWVNRPTFQQADEIQGHGAGLAPMVGRRGVVTPGTARRAAPARSAVAANSLGAGAAICCVRGARLLGARAETSSRRGAGRTPRRPRPPTPCCLRTRRGWRRSDGIAAAICSTRELMSSTLCADPQERVARSARRCSTPLPGLSGTDLDDLHGALRSPAWICSISSADRGRRLLGLLGEVTDLLGDDREAAAVLAGTGGLDRGVERQQVRLRGDAGDRLDDPADLVALLAQRPDRLGRVRRRGFNGAHGGVHLLDGVDALLHRHAGRRGRPGSSPRRSGPTRARPGRPGLRAAARRPLPGPAARRRRRPNSPRGRSRQSRGRPDPRTTPSPGRRR